MAKNRFRKYFSSDYWGKKSFRSGFMVIIIAFLTAIAGGILYIGVITHEIDTRIEQLRAAKGSQFFALSPSLKKGMTFKLNELQDFLEFAGYHEKKDAEDLAPSEFVLTREWDNYRLILDRPDFSGPGSAFSAAKFNILLTPSDRENRLRVEEILSESGDPLDYVDSPPKKLGAFFAGRLRTQNSVPISEIPVNVRYAVMAIEDVSFLEHGGISFRALFRALWADVRTGKWAEGGSTITQQLMKNLFFSKEKLLSRKIKEAIFAYLTEARHEKEAILEAYLNEVYLGQWATHEIHGVSEAARYYFNRDVSDLSLAQAATIAAIIQSPNSSGDPRRYPDKVTKRRNTVLERMLKANFILPEEYDAAITEKLSVVSAEKNLEDADYFMDLVMARLPAHLKSELDKQSLTIYTTLNPYLQSAASKLMRQNIDRIKKGFAASAKKEKNGFHLQGALVAVDLAQCSVVALQGGISYRQTQFNRVLQGKRQPGSLFKPFVFLAGFDKGINGVPLSPLTQLEDTPFEWKYDKQSWKPKNYDGEFRDHVTAREALENSLNIPTARLASMVGVEAIVDTLRQAGIHSPLPAVPSLSLGAADVAPIEMADAYTTLARMGKSCQLRPLTKVFDENGNLVHEETVSDAQTLNEQASFQTISLLKGVFTTGTAKWASSTNLPLANMAGKTGTTNENKDAWFVGFSPNFLTITWMGYDEQENIGLTGAAAALPLWMDFTNAALPFITSDDFVAPEGLYSVEIDPKSLGVAHARCPEKRMEYFVRGTEPTQACHLH